MTRARYIHMARKMPQCTEPWDRAAYSDHYIESRAQKLQDRGQDLANCSHTSMFIVDSRYYCTKHAGRAALRILLGEDT